MRYYPDADVDFFWEFSDGWDRYCRYGPNKRWSHKRWDRVRTINYWRDLEGAKMKEITDADLYIKDWQTDRKRSNVCLPVFYAYGSRYIRLEKDCPWGFKCAPLPINLAEVRKIQAQERQAAKLQRDLEKKEKRAAKKATGKRKK